MILQLSKIGVGHAVVMDTLEGAAHTNSGKVFISEDLLNEVSFVEEGRFVEVGGDPTLRLVGDVAPVQVVSHERAVALRWPRIIDAFLDQQLPPGANASDVLDQLPHEPSGYAPVFFFARQAGLTNQEAAAVVEASGGNRQVTSRLVQQLTAPVTKATGSIRPDAGEPARLRLRFLGLLKAGDTLPVELSANELLRALEAITHVGEEVAKESKERLLAWFKLWPFRDYEGQLLSTFRTAVCHLDSMLYQDETVDEEVNPAL